MRWRMPLKYDESQCLACPLPTDCNDKHPRCFFRIWQDGELKDHREAQQREKEAAQFRAHSQKMNDAKRAKRALWVLTEFKPDTSLAVKYNKRRKPDTPRRQYQRERCRARKNAREI